LGVHLGGILNTYGPDREQQTDWNAPTAREAISAKRFSSGQKSGLNIKKIFEEQGILIYSQFIGKFLFFNAPQHIAPAISIF